METPRKIAQTVKSKTRKMDSNEIMQRRQKRLASAESSNNLPKINLNLSKEEMLTRLKNLIGLTCTTNTEKFHLLRRRDEFLSKLVNLDSKPGNNKFIKGTCQDMCPEKERYMRDVKKSLHFYECDSEGRIVHEKMVKDYSRSAADQDMPLPHELRPLEVLQTTMDYLIFNISSEIPTTKNELIRWCDFLWSRTRAIRKDITQQMLQSEMAVDLVEKCARLHIFSAFKLISLGTEHVNQEINSEMSSLNAASDHPAMAIAAYNTCSHTLRQMYDDLAKMQRSCLNEPEFRSYDIILNLTDFNVYSQVLSYRQSVRESKEVQLALNLASALQNNNYILFFRLVKNHATFLQACLCYQFFASIRSSGLKVICMAFNSFPLEKFIESLAFDSTEQALSFMKVFGVELDRVDPNLLNTRDGKNIFLQNTEMPKPNLIPQMGCKWIEEKSIHLTVPQIFCNCQTPITPPRTTLRHVNNSFSASNVYENDPILDAVLREHKVVVNSVSKKTLPMNFSFARGIQPFKTSKQNYPFSAIQADHIIAKVCNRQLIKISQSSIENYRQLKLAQIRRNLFSIKLRRALKHWINFTKIRKCEKLTKNLVINIANSTLSFIVNSNLERLSAGILRKIVEQSKNRLANEIATIQGDLLLEKVLSEQLSSIVTRVRASQVRDIEDRLKQIGQNLHLIWQRQFTNHWLAKTRRNRLIRSITFLSTESPSSSTQFIDTNLRRFFHPKLKTITTEKLREMAEEKIKINEQKRQEEEELNINNENGFTIVNGFSPAESNGKRATAVSIRDEILDGISFQNENGTQGGGGGFFAESTSKLNLFKPGMTKNAENSQKLVEEMLKKKRRIDDRRRETNVGDDFDNDDVIIDFQSFPTTSELKRRRLI
ncbi:unnamed protein product [Meloidogyne enterolobii]|uniref:Uncharacterized protein n=1 Tax=Meloidogyne enterolobii TaxID=390850 RepID=A0ACB1AD49_MELEN